MLGETEIGSEEASQLRGGQSWRRDRPSVNGDQTPLAGRHLAFFTPIEEMGGSEVLVADVVEAVIDAGARVTCWAPPKGAIRAILANRSVGSQVVFRSWPPEPPGNGSKAIRVTDRNAPRPWIRHAWRRFSPSWIRKIAGFFKDAKAFRKELQIVRPDLVFVHVNASEGVVLGARALLGHRVVTCYHLSLHPAGPGFLGGLSDRFQKMLTMWASPTVIHTSQAVRDGWCRFCLFPRSRTSVIYNGVDPPMEPPSPSSLRGELGIGNQDFVFCVPGRLAPSKGHSRLLDALAAHQRSYEGARVLICGDGPLRADLEAQTAAAGLGQIVRFLGWRRDLHRVLAASNCTILPSVESENLSVAVLESLTSGIPAIVTQVGGMAEAVVDGVTGFVVPPADSAALHEAMQRVLTDLELTVQLGRNAKSDALARFTRNRMRQEYVALLADRAETLRRI